MRVTVLIATKCCWRSFEAGSGCRLYAMENGRKITADDVIARLRDDGDFERLRVGIITKLKQNEVLRSNISSMVKESAAINRPEAVEMQPRELSDAIRIEIGEELMSKVSNELWNIIKSENGMRNEIGETVQSLYYKLLNPKKNQESPSMGGTGAVYEGVRCNGSFSDSVPCSNEIMLSNEPMEPPGFSLTSKGDGSVMDKLKEGLNVPVQNGLDIRKEVKGKNIHLKNHLVVHGCDARESSLVDMEQSPCDDGDDDPDVPPGFGLIR